MLPDNRGKSHVRIAFFTILAIHVVLLGALLLQGCKKTDGTGEQPQAAASTNLPYPPFDATAPPPSTPPVATAPTTPPPETVAPPVTPPPPAPVTEPPRTLGAAREHTVVRGDYYAALATKYGVSIKAIAAANPGVNPTRLQIGQKLNIPAPTTDTTAPKGAIAGGGETGGGKSYVVKSGDYLVKIARQNHVTVKALRAANNLKTDRIAVGQKLTIPAKAAAAPAPAGNPPSAETSAPAPAAP
jgi:LysM repeat protein